MIPSNFLRIITIGFIVPAGSLSLWAEGDVTIVTAPATTSTSSAAANSTAADTTVVHKSSHKKKPKDTSDTASTTSGASATTPVTASSGNQPSSTIKPTGSNTPSKEAIAAGTTSDDKGAAKPNSGASLTVASSSVTPAATPSVETGLPVPRHVGRADIDPTTLPMVSAGYQNLPSSYQKVVAITPPASPVVSTRALNGYSSTSESRSASSDFAFTDFDSRRSRNIYPWKTGIITTEFWIGEGGSSISSTDNVQSAWDMDWKQNYRGTDTPNDRRGYAPAGHAATLNTFYVALPFNDLVYPEKARRWLPAGWHRPPDKDGKPVSACKDRWVQIKNAQGRSCYAQWEDVGPLEYDNAEYVFGSDRPTTKYNGAGLDVSPAVAQYLGIDGKNRITSWRFVDEEDVPPGYWLVYDEQALLYKALHTQSSSTSSQSIQRAADPNEDPSSIDANKQKVGSAKG